MTEHYGDMSEPPRTRAEWSARFPEASSAREALGPDPNPEAMAEWRQRYPSASEAWGLMVLSSPDVARKMRMTDPDWTPPT